MIKLLTVWETYLLLEVAYLEPSERFWVGVEEVSESKMCLAERSRNRKDKTD